MEESCKLYEKIENCRICESTGNISADCKEFRRERSDTSYKTSVWVQVLQREESSGSSGSGNPNSRRYGYIYITENLINHKRYIGQHKWDKDCIDESYKGSGVALIKAFGKYGWDNFKTEVIEWCSSKEELDKREIYWIDFYDAVNSPMFYNISPGGKFELPCEIRVENGRKIKNTLKSKYNNDERYRKDILGKVEYMISNNRRVVIVYDIESEKIMKYNSIKDASNGIKVSECYISACCRGKYDRCKNYICLFGPEIDEADLRERLYRINNPKKRRGHPLTEESKEKMKLHTDRESQGKRISEGLKARMREDEEFLNDCRERARKNGSITSKRVTCYDIETKEVKYYASTYEAARQIGKPNRNSDISLCCRVESLKIFNNCVWGYDNTYEEHMKLFKSRK